MPLNASPPIERDAAQDDFAREAAILDFVNDALPVKERIALARALSHEPEAAAQVLGTMADHDELLLALGVSRIERAAQPEAASVSARWLSAPWLLLRGSGQRAAAVAVAIGVAALVTGSALLPRTADATAMLRPALEADHLARLRLALASQDEDTFLDPQEIETHTGIRLPDLPRGWHLSDAQLYPSELGPSVVLSVATRDNGLLTIFAVRMEQHDDALPVAIPNDNATAAWFRHEQTAYVLIGHQTNGPLDDEALQIMRRMAPIGDRHDVI